MKLDLTSISELFTNFNNLTYHDLPHKYYLDGQELISVTTLIHQYQEEFNEEYWSNYKANQFNLNQYEILRAWNFINKKGTVKGSAIHDYTENLFLNKKYEYPKNLILNEFGFDPVEYEYNITKNHVDNFYKNSFGKLIPIKTECVIYDKESLIAGMFDIIFYNVKANEFQIWDNKTNKELTLEMPNRHLLGDLYLLEDCDLNIYSLQLGLYKYIIENNTSIKLGKSYLSWFSHNNDTYKIIECKDLSYYVNLIVKNRIKVL
jgi:hypothetical protein